MISGVWDADLQNSPYIIQGNWNASTNTPNLTTVTNVGFSWIVSVPGSFNLGGITTWNTNDIAVKTPSGWARITPASATWGTITGTLTNQTDLQNQLNLKATKEEALYDSAGIYVEPTHVNNGNGTITLGNGEYILYDNNTFSGFPKRYSLSGNTYSISTDTINYIIADYNSGSPTVRVTTNVEEINESSIIPILTCYNILGNILTLSWDNLAKGLNNKLHQRLVKTNRFTIEPNGFNLGEKPTRYVTVSGGRVWYGAQFVTIDESDTSNPANQLVLYYIQNGTWIRQVIATRQYNNLNYNAPTGLVELTNNRYAVNWIFKGLSNDSTNTIIVLGNGDYSLSEAQASTIPLLPPVLTNFTFLVGRIIIQKGNTSAYAIQSAFATSFVRTPVTEHNQLSNIQGGILNEHYHHNILEYENHVYKNIINHLIGGQKIGSETSYSEFEEDGTLKFVGNASTWVDVDFPIIIRTTGPNIPTPQTFQGNITMNAWAVNNFAVCEVQEMPHTWKEGSTVYWHVHIFTNSQDATNRYVNFEIEYTWANANSSAPANIIVTSGDFLIPANTPRLTNLIVPIQSFIPVGGKIAAHVKARLRRIASTGTAPSANPFCEMLQLHIEQDTTGSRLITTK